MRAGPARQTPSASTTRRTRQGQSDIGYSHPNDLRLQKTTRALTLKTSVRGRNSSFYKIALIGLYILLGFKVVYDVSINMPSKKIK